MGDDEMMDGGEAEPATARNRAESLWHLRPWLFAGLLGVAGLAIHVLLHHANDSGPRVAGAAFIAFACGAFVFTAERGRYLAPAIFSLVTGLIVGGLTWRAVGAGNDIADGGYAIAAGVFACLLAVPLFQADFLHRRLRTDYKDIHYFVWTDAITGAGAAAFFLIAWLLIWLLASLFDLVGIPLRDLVQEDWFTATYAGLTLGAGLGTLRNQLKIIGTLQSVVLLVLSILALPLAIAIAVFLGAVVVSGPGVLWNATDSATPVLLSIAIGAYVLANAVLRDADEDMVGGAVLKWSGYALVLGILPLTVFAAISTGVRIDQHGLSPERLWAVCSLIVAVAFGLAYFVDALVGARGSWRDRLRASNLKLGLATALFALFLALPVLNFAVISTSDQLARLKSGAISVEEFDFSALRWDFGEPGRAALARLARSDKEDLRVAAVEARDSEDRYAGEARPDGPAEVDYRFADPQLRDWVKAQIDRQPWLCHPECVAIDLGADGDRRRVALVSIQGAQQLSFRDDGVSDPPTAPERALDSDTQIGDSQVEVREYRGRQIYVDGKPVGEPFK
jgi:hypothetical protein